MKQLILGNPNPKQMQFLTDTHRYVAFGGARGGGKSWAVRVKAVLLCCKYPGYKCTIVRKTYRDLQENHIIPLCEMLKTNAPNAKDRLAKYNDAKKHIVFPNGSRILFRYCDKLKDAEGFQGTETDALFVDEATQQSVEKMQKINAIVRGTNRFPHRTYYTCNPGGEGHAWVKRIFIDRKFEGNEKPENYSFIQSLVTDNTALMENDPEYYEQLAALPPKLRKAWLEGRWDIFEGQFFEEFRDDPEHYQDRKYTHVIDPFEIPSDWRIYRSFDWGYSKPFSCAWWAVDRDDVVYRILEYYGCTDTPNEGLKLTPEEVFENIRRIETEHPWLKGKKIYGVADPAIWDAERGVSIAETAERYRIYFEPGDHKRIPGWMQMHYRMCFDDNGYPMMYIFKNCKAFIRTIPQLVFDEHKVEDLDTDGEDHVADEARYFLMARPIAPRIPKERTSPVNNPLFTALDIDTTKLGKARPLPRLEIRDGQGHIEN